MATGFFAVFDDIAVLLDDVAAMSKIATKKTAGLLGDDLAVNAQKAAGFAASRELPVLWAITKGSFINKLIILPFVFLLSAFVPWIIVPILMVGGVYLAFEGVEKIYSYFVPHEKEDKDALPESPTQEDILKHEEKKIKSAIVTDFILSLEIIIIALGTVSDQSMAIQIGVVTFIAVLATIGVYGIVALIVRMDDFGYKLIQIDDDNGGFTKSMGQFLVNALPNVIRGLTIIGTIAMLLVAGGIYVHNVHEIHDFLHFLPSILGELLVGFVVGVLALVPFELFMKLKNRGTVV